MNLKLFLIVAIISFFFIGCSKEPPVIEVTQFVHYECGTPPDIDKFISRPVLIQSKEGEIVLSSQNWVNMEKNLNDILKSSKQLYQLKNFYKNCIEESKQAGEN